MDGSSWLITILLCLSQRDLTGLIFFLKFDFDLDPDEKVFFTYCGTKKKSNQSLRLHVKQ